MCVCILYSTDRLLSLYHNPSVVAKCFKLGSKPASHYIRLITLRSTISTTCLSSGIFI